MVEIKFTGSLAEIALDVKLLGKAFDKFMAPVEDKKAEVLEGPLLISMDENLTPNQIPTPLKKDVVEPEPGIKSCKHCGAKFKNVGRHQYYCNKRKKEGTYDINSEAKTSC